MPKKAYKRKKVYQAFMRGKAKSGFMPNDQGMLQPKNMHKDNSMLRDYFAGYGVGR